MPSYAHFRQLISPRSRVWALAFLLAAVLSLIYAPVRAEAHGGNPDYRSVINRVVPPVPGLKLEVIDYDADIRLTAPAGVRIEIDGYEGEPYARIQADGTVEVNQRSRSAYLNTERYGNAEIPETADNEAKPKWETVREDGVFQWHDHRSHWMSPQPPEKVEDRQQRTQLFDYEIPIRVDGKPATIQGTLFWVGSGSESKLPFFLVGLALQ